MCGIAGYISNQPRNYYNILESLHHRGPDSQGTYITDYKDKNVFLGHKRLSIQDLSEAGNQPMFSEDKQIVLTFNGEIYNFKELRDTFFKGQKFISETDTEVLLKLYELKGIEFLQELNGDFAISILDLRVNKLLVFRDRLGVKPLYYYAQNGELVYASEIKAILAAGVKAQLNKEELQAYFTFKYTPENNTLFKDIYRIPAGHYLSYDLNQSTYTINNYWSPDMKSRNNGTSYEESKNELYHLIEDACRIRLIADVPVGTFFSGGLDSSIIAHFLRDNKEIDYYCASKDEKDLAKEGTTSDFFYAKKMADDWGLKFHEIAIGSNELNQALIQETLKYSDDLIADGSQIPSYLITKKAAEKSTVILSGMGADELFLGYAGHQLLLLDNAINTAPSFLTKPLFKSMSNLNPGVGSFKAYKRYLQKLGNYNGYNNERYAMYNIVGDFDSSRVIFKEKSDTIIPFLEKYFPKGEDPFEGLKTFEKNNFLIKNLHYTDRMSMANSVENRVPFLDHRIVEFAYNLRRSHKLSNTGTTKKILKDTFSQHLPEYVTKRRKAGFGMPLRSLLGDKQRIYSLLSLDFFSEFEEFSVEGIELIIEQHISGAKDNSALIYALISFQEWYKMYIK